MDNKKMIVVNIIEILKKYTDENHVISQKEIIDILEMEFVKGLFCKTQCF